MRTNPETILLAKIRRYIREAIEWYGVDNGMPTYWSTLNYKYSRSMKGLVLTDKEKDYFYYIKSDKAIADIAKKILKEVNKR